MAMSLRSRWTSVEAEVLKRAFSPSRTRSATKDSRIHQAEVKISAPMQLADVMLGQRRFIGASRAGQDAPPFSATSVAENEGAGKPPNVCTGPA
ncbi:hypothetical protein, partial [Thiohalocapsa sp.]|uniref:hypothetical protein n=1 Tax=Thiohalocapsa sp. TaxID=2497641 RepID=UPI0025DC4468